MLKAEDFEWPPVKARITAKATVVHKLDAHGSVMDPGHKRCTRCYDDLPATREFFYSDFGTKDNLTSWCKACHVEARRGIKPGAP